MGASGNPQNVQQPQTPTGYQPMQNPVTAPMAQPGQNVFNQSADAYTAALQGTQGSMNYQPQNVSAQNVSAQNVGTQFGYNPSTVQADTAASAMGAYNNPYTQQVIDSSMGDLERQRQMQQRTMGAQATAAGAFGGSRQGIAEAETNRAYAEKGGQLAAQLRQQGFTTALGAGQQDVANRLNAGIANQNATGRAAEFGQQLGLQGQTANQNTGLQAGIANQNAGLQAGIANQNAGLQGAQFRMGAAGQMGNLSNLGFGYGTQLANAQSTLGAQQQQMMQNLINASRGQYSGFTGAPNAALGTLFGGLGSVPGGQGTTTNRSQPGLMDWISAGAMGLGALCWVAREVYGEDDPRWTQFRHWLLTDAPKWLLKAYATHGEAVARVVKRVPILKGILRPLMDRARRAAGFEG